MLQPVLVEFSQQPAVAHWLDPYVFFLTGRTVAGKRKDIRPSMNHSVDNVRDFINICAGYGSHDHASDPGAVDTTDLLQCDVKAARFAEPVVGFSHAVQGKLIFLTSVILQAAADLVTRAAAGDARDVEVLRALGARNFDCAVVAASSDVGDSALITLNLKELGVSRVVGKASSGVHRKVLEKIGADQVVFPEQEMAVRLARNLSNVDVLNFIELSKDFSVVERRCPPQWQNGTLRGLDIRVKYHLNVVAVRRESGETVISPDGDFVMQAGDCLLVLGSNQDIERMEEL